MGGKEKGIYSRKRKVFQYLNYCLSLTLFLFKFNHFDIHLIMLFVLFDGVDSIFQSWMKLYAT